MNASYVPIKGFVKNAFERQWEELPVNGMNRTLHVTGRVDEKIQRLGPLVSVRWNAI